MSSRYYFDYNATSPLSKKVINFLEGGDFLFGNPSSIHQSGKKSRKHINDTTEYLFNLFNLSPKEFNLFYHSGATEGINSFFKGTALKFFKEKRQACFFFSTVDHACVVQLKDDLELMGHKVSFFDVDRDGNFNSDELTKNILIQKDKGNEVFLNFTNINNETGVVWPLSLASKIKKETGVIIHVDAVQLVGKIEGWNNLSTQLDAYTFSGHKFGAMKGVGFSYVTNQLKLPPLLIGGNQQDGLRAGTENALGVYSLKLALSEIVEKFNPSTLLEAKNLIEKKLLAVIGTKGEIVAVKSATRNLNTIFIILHGKKAETLSAQFDILGIDVSTGSACSSGIIKENRILMNMGYSRDESRASLRFSFSPLMQIIDAEVYSEKIVSVLNKLL